MVITMGGGGGGEDWLYWQGWGCWVGEGGAVKDCGCTGRGCWGGVLKTAMVLVGRGGGGGGACSRLWLCWQGMLGRRGEGATEDSDSICTGVEWGGGGHHLFLAWGNKWSVWLPSVLVEEF